MHRGIAFFALLLCILPSLQAQRACTSDDYAPAYTACDANGMRQAVWSLKPGVSCTGGAAAPSPVTVQCNISCSAGYYLPIGMTACSPCQPGQFSIGAGYREDTWYTWSPYFDFGRYFYNYNLRTPFNYSGQDTDAQWHLATGGVLQSGKITDSQDSVLELNVTIVSLPAHVSFSYRVSAEHTPSINYDGLQFEVDGRIVMTKVSYVTSFVTFTANLTVGDHKLRWVYYKDVSISQGEDAAFIQMIEIAGIIYAADSCEACPPGTFSNTSAARECLACPANTYSNVTAGATQCTNCPAGAYSFPEAEFCLPRPACTANDYEFIYSSCSTQTGTRTLYPRWLTPIICDTSSATLPPAQEGLPCGDCSDGSTRNPTTDECDYCPDGMYSVGGAPCTECPAGTAAIKVHDVNQFNDWVPGSRTDCSGDCSGQGWELHSNYMDSGTGHGEAVNSWFSFNTNLISQGTISFKYRVFCNSSCNFEFSNNPGQRISPTISATLNYTSTTTLAAGNHVLNWTFSKFGNSASRSDRVVIYSIVITHTQEGGAVECTACTGNTISAADSTFCSPCPAGTQSDASHTTCSLCPEGYFSATAGGTCIPCGDGTTAFANRTGCNVNCTFNDGSRLYDLNPLRTHANVYGPVNETSRHNLYYFSVCGTLPDVCYDTKDTFIHSYACQQTTILLEGNHYEGMDLGEVLGWAPHVPVNASDFGVVMKLGYGSDSLNCGKPRSTTINFQCDPSAGVGTPEPNGTSIEPSLCTYVFKWRSIYACPVCDQNVDMAFYYTECTLGFRNKTFMWREGALCHGGVLPPPQTEACTGCSLADYVESYTECHPDNTRDVIFYPKQGKNCTGSITPTPIYGLPCNTECPAGQYLPMGARACVTCSPGSFSIGGGYREDTWFEWPAFFPFTRYFYTQITDPNYTSNSTSQWRLERGVIRSGNITNSQTSVLELTVFVVANTGHVSFTYRVNAESPTYPFDGIQFEVDSTIMMSKVSYQPQYTTVTYPLSIGVHVLRWKYIKDISLNRGEDSAFIQMIEIGGLLFADESCELCPEGTYADFSGASDCMPCPANTYAGFGFSECSQCPTDQYSYSEAATCETRQPCTSEDYELVYTPCDSTGHRSLYAEWLTPVICDTAHATLPTTQQNLPCGTCSDGSTRNPTTHQCSYCPDGTNSTHGAACQDCPAGTAAIKTHVVNQFDDWVIGSSTDCAGDCFGQGWELHSTYMDSGEGHGRFATSWFQFTTTLIAAGQITFDYQLLCPTADCSLEFSSNDEKALFITPTYNYTYTKALTAGVHSLNWTFAKTGYGDNRNDKAMIYRIVITHTAEGGAVACTKCANGTVSNADSTICTTCQAGYQSNAAGNQCEPCPDGWFNPTPGGMCIACGSGTTSLPDHTGCLIDCTYNDGSRKYDFNAIKDNAPLYGPVTSNATGQARMYYYLSICNQLPDVCYATKDTFIHSYACQQTPAHIAGSDFYEGEDLGNLLGWAPLPKGLPMYNNSQLGAIMMLQRGTPGCSASYHGTNIFRESHIAFVCDPSAGIGYPVANNTIENSPCIYSFQWRSLYACPVCDTNDVGFYYSPCQDGQRTKMYYWLHFPRQCHGGELPQPEVVSCSETNTRCPAGTYLSEITEQCTSCSAGTYSVGGGELISSWSPLPARFTTSCVGTGCTNWQAGVGGEGTISSGNGTSSTLSASFNFVVPGSVSFQYKVYGAPNEIFIFMIDNVPELPVTYGSSVLTWSNARFNFTAGVHTLSWTYVRGFLVNSTTPRTGAIIHHLTFIGTDYHDDACTPCPAGFYSPADGAASCMPCALNSVSSDDASECSVCGPSETALFHGSECIPRSPCTDADWGYVYSKCGSNNTRTRTPTYLAPMICTPTTDLPAADTVPCAPCTLGTHPTSTPGECTGCPAGQVYKDGACTPVPAGSTTVTRKYYFDGRLGFPADWATSCTGDCGSSGWRLKDEGTLDSGDHLTNAVDSLLIFTNKIGNYGAIAFAYNVPLTGSNGLSIYVNGTLAKILTGSGTFSQPLPTGQVTVIFDYWQLNGTKGRALVSDIIVTGSLAGDAGSAEMLCPAGTATTAPGSTVCEICQPGYFSFEAGSSACDPCPAGEYSSDYGATHCKICHGETYTLSEGSSYCLSDCTYSSFVKGEEIEFSLTAVNGTYGPVRVGNPPVNIDYWFNFCNASLGTAPCAPNKPTHACAVEPGATSNNRDWGSDFNFVAMHDTEQEIFSGSVNTTFQVSFENGESANCPPGTNRSTVFRFSCNVDRGIGTPVAQPRNFQNICTTTFDWASILGCPVCKDYHYSTVTTDCVDGVQTTHKTRLVPCNGPALEVTTKKCSGGVKTSIGVVFAVLAVILALVIGAAVIIIKNRKMTTQFMRLKMNGRGFDTTSTSDFN